MLGARAAGEDAGCWRMRDVLLGWIRVHGACSILRLRRMSKKPGDHKLYGEPLLGRAQVGT